MKTAAPTSPTPPGEFHPNCFVCGQDRPFGLGLRCEIDLDGGATARWEPSPAFQSYPDRLHGGILAALVDGAMVYALHARGLAGVTVELNIRYLRSARLTLPLEIAARVEAVRRGLFRGTATIDQGCQRIVRASAKFMTGSMTGL
ncbi:MAG: PaaI family thioesterase [Akkermansiaceae bacterium]|nr:PaaI family thioesterase [Akkermansiaceae bacterium]